MTELYIFFRPNQKQALDIIKKIEEQLEICLKRKEISEYEIGFLIFREGYETEIIKARE